MRDEKRTVIALIGIDEGKMETNQREHNEDESIGTMDYIEQEFGWLEASGIKLQNAVIADADVIWEGYLLYLAEWIMNHQENDKDESPESYSEWNSKRKERRVDE